MPATLPEATSSLARSCSRSFSVQPQKRTALVSVRTRRALVCEQEATRKAQERRQTQRSAETVARPRRVRAIQQKEGAGERSSRAGPRGVVRRAEVVDDPPKVRVCVNQRVRRVKLLDCCVRRGTYASSHRPYRQWSQNKRRRDRSLGNPAHVT